MNKGIILIILVLFFTLNKRFNQKVLNQIFKIKKNKKKSKLKIVTPQLVYQALKENNKNIFFVNVLSDKMKYKITVGNKIDPKSLTKDQFENKFIKKNKIPSNFIIVLYCASWSCRAAKNYYKKLKKLKINVENVLYYIGGIHEWASYSKINPRVFTFHSTENNKKLNNDEVNDIIKNTGHGYYVNNVLKDPFFKKISQKGNNYLNLLK